MTEGKKFENNFKKSIPEDVWCYRLRDTATSYYGGNEFLRFSGTNIADFIVYGGNGLYICELKAHAGKNIPISCIRSNQINMMLEASKYKGVDASLYVFFYTESKCFKLKIEDFYAFLQESNRKSVPIAYFEEKGTKIEVKPLRTNYRYVLNFK